MIKVSIVFLYYVFLSIILSGCSILNIGKAEQKEETLNIQLLTSESLNLDEEDQASPM